MVTKRHASKVGKRTSLTRTELTQAQIEQLDDIKGNTEVVINDRIADSLTADEQSLFDQRDDELGAILRMLIVGKAFKIFEAQIRTLEELGEHIETAKKQLATSMERVPLDDDKKAQVLTSLYKLLDAVFEPVTQVANRGKGGNLLQ